MNRRDVVRTLGLISGHALFPTVLGAFITGCANKDMSAYKPEFFSEEEYKSITRMIDIILPETTTKSASGVNAQIFLDQVFSKCMDASQQKVIRDGLHAQIAGFNDAPDRHAFLASIDQKAFNGNDDYAWFRTIKRYTLIGFFTSREGTTHASNYVKVPDTYRGEIPMDANTLNYGKTNLHY